MKYIIVYGSNMHSLETQVNKYLEQGYKCQGGVSTNQTNVPSIIEYYQAMIKE